MTARRHSGRLREIHRRLRRADRLLICTHQHPDGDCIGSMLALYHYLRGLGKTVWMFNADPVPETFRFLPGWRQIRNSLKGLRPEVVVLLDSGAWSRLGFDTTVLELLPVINVDHHPDNKFRGPGSIVDPSSSSVGELLTEMIVAVGGKLTPAVALCLYVAVLTDTGSFRQANTTAQTLGVAARLLDSGRFAAATVADAVYGTVDVRQLRLLRELIGSIRLERGSRLAWGELTPLMFSKAGARDEDTEGLINYLRTLKGVQVAAVFRTLPGGKTKLNLRSRSGISVLPLVREFGGGGHASAAGCTVAMSLARARRAFLPRLRRLVK